MPGDQGDLGDPGPPGKLVPDGEEAVEHPPIYLWKGPKGSKGAYGDFGSRGLKGELGLKGPQVRQLQKCVERYRIC
jgi:hypothetical protein